MDLLKKKTFLLKIVTSCVIVTVTYDIVTVQLTRSQCQWPRYEDL